MRRTLSALALAALLAACGGDASGPEVPIGGLILTPPTLRMSSGESQIMTCSAVDPVGQPLANLPPVTWIFSDQSIALVEDIVAGDRRQRRIVATGIGATRVRCRYGGLEATALVTVVPFTVSASDTIITLPVGGTAQLTASVKTFEGTSVPLVLPIRLLWSSGTPGVARVEAGSAPGTAVVTAVTPGTAILTAEVRNVTDVGGLGNRTIRVTVLPPS